MSSRPVRRLRSALLILAALIAVLVVAAPTQAEGPKSYDPDAPATLAVGATTQFQFTIKNTSKNAIAFNGVRVTVPSALKGYVSGTPIVAAPATVSINQTTGVIEVLSSNMAKGQTLTITIPMTVPCSAAAASGTWVTDVRQSNDFNGTGNQFERIGSDPATALSGACTGYTASAAPSSSPAGTSQSIAVTLTNAVAGAPTFKGARITIPAPYVVTAAISVSSGTFTVSAGVIEVINANVAALQSLVVTVPVSVPCGPSDVQTWVTDVRSGNIFTPGVDVRPLNGPAATTSISGKCAYSVAATAVNAGDPGGSVDLTITNGSGAAFNGVQVAVPGSVLPVIPLAAVVTASAGTVGYSAGVVTVTGSATAPAASLVIHIPVAPTCAFVASGNWATDVFQSSTLAPAGKFLDPSEPPVTANPCVLSFLTQPNTVVPGEVITGSPNDPDGAPVQVKVSSGGIPSVGVSGVPVTITGDAALGLTGNGPTATNASGVAMFGALKTVNSDDINGTYQLTASAFGTSVQSNPFDVFRFRTSGTCTQGGGQESDDTDSPEHDCTTGKIYGPDGETAEVVLNDGDEVDGTIVAAFGDKTFDCPYYAEIIAGELSFNLITDDVVTGMTKTITLTVEQDLLKTAEWQYQICFLAPYEFPAMYLANGAGAEGLDPLYQAISEGNLTAHLYTEADLTAGVITDASLVGQYIGLLLPCGLIPGSTDIGAPELVTVPCISERSFYIDEDDNPRVSIVVKTAPLDPSVRF